MLFVIDDWISQPHEPTVYAWKLVSKVSPSYVVYYYSRTPPCPPDFTGCRIETIGDILLVKLYQEFVVDATQDDVAGMLANIETSSSGPGLFIVVGVVRV